MGSRVRQCRWNAMYKGDAQEPQRPSDVIGKVFAAVYANGFFCVELL